MAEKKPKITIGPNGTIDVDNDGSEPKAPGKKHAAPTASNIDPDGTIHVNHRNGQSSAQKKASGAAPHKTTTPPTGNQAAATPSRGVEFRDTSPQSQQPPKKRKPIPDSVKLLLLGVGMVLLGVFVWPDLWFIGVGVFSIVVAFYCNEWH